MKAFGTDIRSLYFEYKSPVWHEQGCSHAASGLLNAGLFTYESVNGETKETSIRLLCPAAGGPRSSPLTVSRT